MRVFVSHAWEDKPLALEWFCKAAGLGNAKAIENDIFGLQQFVIGKDGKIIAVHRGYNEEASAALDKEVKDALQVK